MELMFRAKGSVNCLCDRCGGDLKLPLDHQEMRIVKFSHEDFDNTDDFDNRDDLFNEEQDNHEIIDNSNIVFNDTVVLPSNISIIYI